MPARPSRARIAVIFEPRARQQRKMAVHYLAEFWRERGLEVVFGYGPRDLPEADLALLHVDLSVVPRRYLDAYDRYPIVLNGRILDIRKSRTSSCALAPGSEHAGPVIVKTDLNSAGRPEWRSLSGPARLLQRARDRVRGRRRIGRARDYRVYDALDAVPETVWRDPRLVVEAFRPERTAVGYAARRCFVLGDAAWIERSEAPSPIVCDETAIRFEHLAPDPELETHRSALRLDFGKIDYTVSDGEVVLFDVNKTIGASTNPANEEMRARRRSWAAGIESYLDGSRKPA